MNIAVLKTELLAGHPSTGPYDANDVAAAAQINVVNRQRNRASMTGSEVLNAVVLSEFNALADVKQDRFMQLIGIGILNPFGREADLITSLFGGGSGTVTALASARKEDISRAVELGLGVVKLGHIQMARL